MSDSCLHTNPLSREGTSQTERMPPLLNPDQVKLHDLDVDDWLEFAAEYAKLIHYFRPDDPENPAGDWQDFFESREEISELTDAYTDGEADPYFGLFICFLKLLAFPQKSLNRLPEKHLNYYYREVLKLKEKPCRPDRVHVLFELAKTAQNTLLEEGTLLDAGNDSNGNPLRYSIASPVVVNPAKVETVRSVFTDDTGILRAALNSKHPDGLDEDADEGSSWLAFGDKNWPEAELSFYIASPLLRMKEGIRTITLTMTFDTSLQKTIHSSHLKVSCTGEEDWIECSIIEFEAIKGTKKIELSVGLSEDDAPVVNLDEEIHESTLQISQPVMKLTFTNPIDYSDLSTLKLQKTDLNVRAEGIRDIELRNEMGILDSSKPFMPFGANPKIGSKLRLYCEEMNRKPVKKIDFHLQWLNAPPNFSHHYRHYNTLLVEQSAGREGIILTEEDDEKLKGQNESNTSQTGTGALFFGKQAFQMQGLEALENLPVYKAALETLIYYQFDHLKHRFKTEIRSPFFAGEREFRLFTDEVPTESEKTLSVTLTDKTAVRKSEFEFSLIESFYHELYSRLYVANAINSGKTGVASPDDLPNEPYTPLLDELTLDYSAESTLDTSSSGYNSEDSLITLFRQHPFGTEQVREREPSPLPGYQNRSLFIGLKNLKPGSNISLLFQVDEGSENPEHSHFDEGDEPKWSVLAGENWRQLEEREIVRDNTNNFLRPGIVELQIPRQSTQIHTLMDPGLIWLRISINKPADAVPEFIKIHAQAAEAVFSDNGNSKDHLENLLPPESISQLVIRRSSIQSAEQPYTSFDGAPAESSRSFYRRVSERIRHKNRSVSIWDYERLVLEQFPEIYKIKCLNHTWRSENKLYELAPGHVTLVLIPKLPESSRNIRFYPKASQDLMDRVRAFLKNRMTLHARLHVTNPEYEELSFRFDVMFKHGLDFSHHRLRAEEDLKKLLTPWMFDRSAEIRFGESFYKYEIIHYLENLGYIDYVENFSMVHNPSTGGGVAAKQIQPGSPVAILVSGNHDIQPAEPC
jgi:hypothetical protein